MILIWLLKFFEQIFDVKSEVINNSIFWYLLIYLINGFYNNAVGKTPLAFINNIRKSIENNIIQSIESIRKIKNTKLGFCRIFSKRSKYNKKYKILIFITCKIYVHLLRLHKFTFRHSNRWILLYFSLFLGNIPQNFNFEKDIFYLFHFLHERFQKKMLLYFLKQNKWCSWIT